MFHLKIEKRVEGYYDLIICENKTQAVMLDDDKVIFARPIIRIVTITKEELIATLERALNGEIKIYPKSRTA